MELTALSAVSQDFSHFYRNEWFLTNRQWKMRGIQFSSMKAGTVDTEWAEQIIVRDAESYEEAKRACEDFRSKMKKRHRHIDIMRLQELERMETNHMPSHEVSVLLLFAQVKALRDMERGLRVLTHHEMIYDVLTVRAMRFHHSVMGINGKPKKTFLQNPITHLENLCKKVVNQLMYDIYRTSIEARNGVVSRGIRAPEREGRLLFNTSAVPSDDLINVMDAARVHGVSVMSLLTKDNTASVGASGLPGWWDAQWL